MIRRFSVWRDGIPEETQVEYMNTVEPVAEDSLRDWVQQHAVFGKQQLVSVKLVRTKGDSQIVWHKDSGYHADVNADASAATECLSLYGGELPPCVTECGEIVVILYYK